MPNTPSPPAPDDSARNDARLGAGLAWAKPELGAAVTGVSPLAGDASFRRYFRLASGRGTAILMDAPPEREDSRRFIDIATRLRAAGIHAPQILSADPDLGFLLLEDLGDTLLREVLHTNNADDWFPRLFALLARLARHVDPTDLPAYDRERLVTELELFPAWYLERHKGVMLSCEEWDLWEDLCTQLVLSAQHQPQVFVHRDFHSCNLLRLPGNGIGVIDFQDAVRGPLSYDFISLLWDRYIPWPRSRLEAWMEDFRQQVSPDSDPDSWRRQCDWMGLQRNLKVVGIFARLNYRDGKRGYLEMIPRFWNYVTDVLPRYSEFAPFSAMLERLACAP